MNKEELIRAIMADRVTSARNQGRKVHAYGDAAVVTGILRNRPRKEGAFDRRYRFTDPWLFWNKHGERDGEIVVTEANEQNLDLSEADLTEDD